MKPGDIIRIKLGHDVHEAEVVKENAKTVLVKVLWSRTRHRKVKPDITKTGQMSLFGGVDSLLKSTKVPYTVSGMKIIKIPKVKIVSKPEPSPVPAPQETTAEEVQVPESEYEGPGLGKDETPLVEYPEPKPDPFADLEAAIKEKTNE